MSMKTFQNNGVNISENIATLNLWYIIIWSTYMQKKHIVDNIMISLLDENVNPLSHSSQLWVIIESVSYMVTLICIR